MHEDHLILRTNIKTTVKNSVLFRGTFIAALGGVTILIGGFITKGVLTIWGLPLYLVGAGLIVIGLKPLRILQRLENHPNEIYVNQNLMLTFKTLGQPVFTTSLGEFNKIDYVDRGEIYGLCLWFAQQESPDIFFYNDAKVNLRKLQIEARNQFGCDLFLPYFNQRAYQALLEFIEAEKNQKADSSE